MREKVEAELQRLQDQGFNKLIQYSEWVAPIVPVMKHDRSIQICGDYKLTVNAAAKVDKYLLPKVDDLFATLAGGEKFTKLDLSQAYQQVLLDDKSQAFVVNNTNKGLFRYNRLPFGYHRHPVFFGG
ncbi:hypothetical protein BSL78_06428 [Apostichopus japonicus]|uniref:Reverse transcriptase domain-containing protein n=1 Tax=Stichopus japonicus TaxID=307972 RepID=A0A2G8L8R4_STIJA|nr:hypothetical protein BSL78_06428 [Apostichopus japonicus]